jgi:hypothetical protein
MSEDPDLRAAWAALTERIDGLSGLLTDADSDTTQAEGVRYLLRFLGAGIRVCAELDDTTTPTLGAMVEPGMTWGLDNPDCLYRYTRIDPAGTYRIHGTRGTACHLEIQVNTGHFGDGDFAGWTAVASVTGDDLVLDTEGRFELVLSPGEPGAGETGRRLALDGTASFVLVRQYFADWEEERPAHLVIERTDRAGPPAPVSPRQIDARLALLAQWLEVGGDCWQALSAGIRTAPVGEIRPFVPPASASGLKGLAYGFGPWRCGADEAVIVEVTPPPCRLWGLSLCDRWWQSIDFAERQSSLNQTQGVLDRSGRFVGVISRTDPGIVNWLDPGGETEGTLAVRYLLGDALPPATLRTVRLQDLADELPADTARIDPAGRDAALRRRREAVLARFGR